MAVILPGTAPIIWTQGMQRPAPPVVRRQDQRATAPGSVILAV